MWQNLFNNGLHAATPILAAILLILTILRSQTIKHRGIRFCLLLLRACVVTAVLIIIADPKEKKIARNPQKNRPHYILMDTSQSMRLGRPETRLENISKTLASVMQTDASRGNVSIFTFDEQLQPVEKHSLPDKALGESTFLAGALTKILEGKCGPLPADITLFSDGRIHDKEGIPHVVRLARRHDIPIYGFIPKETHTLINLSIENCIVQRRALPNSRVPLRVVVNGTGISGQRCVLSLNTADGATCLEVPFTAQDGIASHDLFVDVGDTPQKYVLTASGIPAEINHQDNQCEFNIDIITPKLRVIYMEGTHEKNHWGRWEHEFIEFALKQGGDIEVDVFYADDQWSKQGHICSVKDPERGYPTSREMLYTYDVVISSDISRYLFTDEQKQWTVDLVAERGGGFCMIGGNTSFGSGDYDKTIWEKLIPVDMTLQNGQGGAHESFKLLIPEEAMTHPIMQISPDPDTNRSILNQIPRFLGTNFVKDAKPGATVLAYHDKRNMPIICVQPYGKGRTMAFVTDSTDMWGRYFETRWGKGTRDNRYFNRFWINAVRWLGENSVSKMRNPLQGDTERIAYRAGETVNVSARWLNVDPNIESHEIGSRANIQVKAEMPGSPSQAVLLRYDAKREEYLGRLKLPDGLSEGTRTIVFIATGKEINLATDQTKIQIVPMHREFSNPQMDSVFLASLAKLTGGRMLTTRGEFLNLLKTTPSAKTIEKTCMVPLWDRMWLWNGILILLTLEWFIRRWARAA